MSVWSELTGTVKVEKGFSIKKYTKELLSVDYSLKVTHSQFFDTVELHVCLDGNEAWECLRKWCSGLLGTADVNISVRVIK